MSKQTRRSIVELVLFALVLVGCVVRFGWATGVPAAVGGLFAYGFISVLMKFSRVKAMALKSASQVASTD